MLFDRFFIVLTSLHLKCRHRRINRSRCSELNRSKQLIVSRSSKLTLFSPQFSGIPLKTFFSLYILLFPTKMIIVNIRLDPESKGTDHWYTLPLAG